MIIKYTPIQFCECPPYTSPERSSYSSSVRHMSP